MKKILVPLTFHPNCSNLLDYACSFLERSSAQATLLCNTGIRALKRGGFTYTHGEDDPAKLDNIRSKRLRRKVEQTLEQLEGKASAFQFKFQPGNLVRAINRECETGSYDLLVVASQRQIGALDYFTASLPSRLIGDVKVPVLVVPNGNNFNDIQDITYAVDLTDYDPRVIQQVKSIAAMFDARLTIAHVNIPHESDSDSYLSSLEQTISDTLDYPKVYYKFFDYSDPFAGIKRFVHQNKTHMVALTNRTKPTWRSALTGKSFTRRMAQDLEVPVLAFRK